MLKAVSTSYIKFVFIAHSTKTSIWEVITLDDSQMLGSVRWFGRWRKYSFFPYNNTVYEVKCLRDIANFCEDKTLEHNRMRKQNVADTKGSAHQRIATS